MSNLPIFQPPPADYGRATCPDLLPELPLFRTKPFRAIQADGSRNTT
ncbi:MAG: hypothetical protein ACU0BK_04735 [Shimia sp.]